MEEEEWQWRRSPIEESCGGAPSSGGAPPDCSWPVERCTGSQTQAAPQADTVHCCTLLDTVRFTQLDTVHCTHTVQSAGGHWLAPSVCLAPVFVYTSTQIHKYTCIHKYRGIRANEKANFCLSNKQSNICQS